MDDKLALKLILAYRDQVSALEELCLDLLPKEEDSRGPLAPPTPWQRFVRITAQDVIGEIISE